MKTLVGILIIVVSVMVLLLGINQVVVDYNHLYFGWISPFTLLVGGLIFGDMGLLFAMIVIFGDVGE